MAPFLVCRTRGGQGDGSPVLLIKLFYLKRQENRPLVPFKKTGEPSPCPRVLLMSRCKYAMPTYSERFASSLSRHSPYACKKRHSRMNASIHLECLFLQAHGSLLRANYLFENCGARRAFFSPYFFLSFIRGSRVRKPAFFRAGRYSSSTSRRAREIP